MNEGRQRAAFSWVTAASVLLALTLGSGCEARSSIEGAQTAVAVAQTALPGLQTTLPGVQATAQAGATVVSAVLSDPRAISAQMQMLLAGATVELITAPVGAANDAVRQVSVSAIDDRGSLGQLDQRARDASASAALLLAGQYYPNATITLLARDPGGAKLVSGTRGPGESPVLQ